MKKIITFIAIAVIAILLLGGVIFHSVSFDRGYNQSNSEWHEILNTDYDIFTDFDGKPIMIEPIFDYSIRDSYPDYSTSYDDTEAFEEFITWITDDDGNSLMDFDMSFEFVMSHDKNMDVTVHVKKGDNIGDKIDQ